jgi:hypothetical protein
MRDTIITRNSAIGTPTMAGGTKPQNAGTTAMTIHQDVPADAAQIGKTRLDSPVAQAPPRIVLDAAGK